MTFGHRYQALYDSAQTATVLRGGTGDLPLPLSTEKNKNAFRKQHIEIGRTTLQYSTQIQSLESKKRGGSKSDR